IEIAIADNGSIVQQQTPRTLHVEGEPTHLSRIALVVANGAPLSENEPCQIGGPPCIPERHANEGGSGGLDFVLHALPVGSQPLAASENRGNWRLAVWQLTKAKPRQKIGCAFVPITKLLNYKSSIAPAYPLTHTTWRRVWTISTRSFWASMTASMDL